MNVREYTSADRKSLVALVAAFRVDISSLRGRERGLDLAAAADELQEYIDKAFPIVVVEDDSGRILGYLVCRVDGSTLWAESLFVSPKFRRRGIAGMLYDAAEQLARNRGEPTIYNWVHPNNDPIIAFLKARGYDVLNLIEIRRRLPGEEPQATLRIAGHDYGY